LDPSEFRPEKEVEAFRDYSENKGVKECVRRTYHQMHTNQTVDYVKEQHQRWLKFDKIQLSIMDALEMLNKVIDESDPDTDLPNIVHAFQTAERIREAGHPDWFQLVGLIHDLGKIMALYGQPQWSTVGDTYPVGCKPSSTIVFADSTFEDCPDRNHSIYSTELGMYTMGCGFDKLLMSWGHDEYLYRVLKNHGTTIPDEGLYMIRFHSFYPWHTGHSYKQFENDTDCEMLSWVNEFNKFDLYSKADSIPDIDALRPYYQRLVEKYVSPGLIRF